MMPEVLASELAHIKELLKNGFADLSCDIGKIDTRLKELNGTVRDHDKTIALHEQDIKRLEAWQRGFNRSMLQAVGVGAGIIVTAAGILFGLGRAAGLW